jgi:hypothetical protein
VGFDGNVTEIGSQKSVFYVPDGEYLIINQKLSFNILVSIYPDCTILIKENLNIIQNCNITLDEREAVKVGFNPGKINQIQCYAFIRIEKKGFSLFFQAIDFLISPNNHFNMSLYYQFHPKLRLFKGFLWYLFHETRMPSYYVVHFNQQGINKDTTFKPDYQNFIKRKTVFKNPQIEDGTVIWGIFSFINYDELVPIFAFSPFTSIHKTIRIPSPYILNVYLQPEPVKYVEVTFGSYLNHGFDFLTLESESYGKNSNPNKIFGEHPLTSGYDVYIVKKNETSKYLFLYGTALEDAYGNNFFSNEDETYMTIIQDGQILYDDEPLSNITGSITFEDTSSFEIIYRCDTNLSITSKTYTTLKFNANLSMDSNPPDVYIRCSNNNLYNKVVTTENKLNLEVEVRDKSPLLKVELEYSTDNGKTWKQTSLTPIGDSKWITSIETTENQKISLRAYSIDDKGNSITHTAIDSVYMTKIKPLMFNLYKITEKFPQLFILFNRVIEKNNLKN